MDAIHEWMLMLADETEIVPHAFGTVQFLLEALARNALGEEMNMPANLAQTVDRDELHTWFEREMLTSE